MLAKNLSEVMALQTEFVSNLKGEVTEIARWVQDNPTLITPQDIDTAVSNVELSFFTLAERTDIYERIDRFESRKADGKNARSGGSQLLKELEKVERTKDDLLKWIANIREILSPIKVEKVSAAQAKAEAVQKSEQETLERIAQSLVGLKESVLRSFAQSLIGDAEQNYVKEELPLVIATRQVTGMILLPNV